MLEVEPEIESKPKRLSKTEAQQEAGYISAESDKTLTKEDYAIRSMATTVNRVWELVSPLGLSRMNRGEQAFQSRPSTETFDAWREEGVESGYKYLRTTREALQKALGLVDKELSYFNQDGEPISSVDKFREQLKAQQEGQPKK